MRTPGPWRQGFLLNTPRRRWTVEERDRGNEIEKRQVFSNFYLEDQGRSRQRVCVCENPDDAQIIADLPKMNDVLKKCELFIEATIIETGFMVKIKKELLSELRAVVRDKF